MEGRGARARRQRSSRPTGIPKPKPATRRRPNGRQQVPDTADAELEPFHDRGSVGRELAGAARGNCVTLAAPMLFASSFVEGKNIAAVAGRRSGRSPLARRASGGRSVRYFCRRVGRPRPTRFNAWDALATALAARIQSPDDRARPEFCAVRKNSPCRRATANASTSRGFACRLA
jgi:hypothetical protein